MNGPLIEPWVPPVLDALRGRTIVFVETVAAGDCDGYGEQGVRAERIVLHLDRGSALRLSGLRKYEKQPTVRAHVTPPPKDRRREDLVDRAVAEYEAEHAPISEQARGRGRQAP